MTSLKVVILTHIPTYVCILDKQFLKPVSKPQKLIKIIQTSSLTNRQIIKNLIKEIQHSHSFN